MALAAIACALAPGAVTLALATAVLYVAIGTASGLAQAVLIDSRVAAQGPGSRGRTMARWTLFATAGDLAAPTLLAVVGSWRLGFVVVGVALLVVATALARAELADSPAPDDLESPGVWAALRSALTDPVLISWLFATALCDLLDEIVIVFASIHVREDLGGSVLAQSATVAAFVTGGAIGLLALDVVLRRRSEIAVLVACAVACALCYAAWLGASGPWATAVLMLPVGATAAPLYPLAAAQSYARRPDAPGSVLAASPLFTPLGLALPFVIGLVADHAGTTVALALLLVQPLGLALLAVFSRTAQVDPP
jgi:fucose permease